MSRCVGARPSTTSGTKMVCSTIPTEASTEAVTRLIAGVIKATHPDFKHQPLSPPEELSDAGRVRRVSGTPGKPPAYAGTDFVVARNGRIAAIYMFFDSLP